MREEIIEWKYFTIIKSIECLLHNTTGSKIFVFETCGIKPQLNIRKVDSTLAAVFLPLFGQFVI